MSTTTQVRHVPLLTPLIKRETLEFWLQLIRPVFAIERTLAEVVHVERSTEQVATLSLRPNGNWRGFRPGQHVLVTLEVDGRRITRPWTIASGTHEPRLRLSIARQPGGKATNWVHDRLQPGDIVELSNARGSFTLPDDADSALLFIAGGTGITPFLSMLRTLSATKRERDITLLYYVRSEGNALASEELKALASQHSGLSVFFVPSEEAAPVHGYFASSHLDTLVPDWRERAPFVCGPAPMMALVEAHFRASPAAQALQLERFRPPAIPTDDTREVRLRFARSDRQVTTSNERTLLEEAEAAGLSPHYGCRSGICRECTCTKLHGAVQNLRTGEINREDGESIQICISRPLSDVELDI